MSLSFKKTCNVAIASAAVGLAQHFAGKELHQGPYLVKQVGALNMKLQMQRADLKEEHFDAKFDEATARRADVPTLKVVNHSYTGDVMKVSGIGSHLEVLQSLKDRHDEITILDPAGAQFMQQADAGQGAGSLSKIIYKLIRSDGLEHSHNYGMWQHADGTWYNAQRSTSIPLPEEAKAKLVHAGNAYYVDYNDNMPNRGTKLTNELSVIHSIGPNGTEYSITQQDKFKQVLQQTYENAFEQFRANSEGKKELWINPVSSGIFCPGWVKSGFNNGQRYWNEGELQEFALLTANSVFNALVKVPFPNVHIKMHIFEEAEFKAFENAFNKVFADHENKLELGASLLEYDSDETLDLNSVVGSDDIVDVGSDELSDLDSDKTLAHSEKKAEISMAKPVQRGRRARRCLTCCGGRPNKKTNSA